MSSYMRCSFELFRFKHNLYKLREERAIKPATFGQLVSSTLYEKRCVDKSCCSVLVIAGGMVALSLA